MVQVTTNIRNSKCTIAPLHHRFVEKNVDTVRSKVKHLLKDGAIEKCGEFVENGVCKHRYKKRAVLVI